MLRATNLDELREMRVLFLHVGYILPSVCVHFRFHAVRSRLTYFSHDLLPHIVQQVRWYTSEKSIKVLTCLTLLGLNLGFSLFPEHLACRYLEVTESVCVCAMLWHQTCVCDEYYLPLSLYLSSSLASFIC